jgi:hypothetical protein
MHFLHTILDQIFVAPKKTSHLLSICSQKRTSPFMRHVCRPYQFLAKTIIRHNIKTALNQQTTLLPPSSEHTSAPRLYTSMLRYLGNHTHSDTIEF